MENRLLLKKDDKNGESKISIYNLIIIIFFIIALIYVIFLFIKAGFEKTEVYYKSNIKSYITSDNLVTSDYFYTLDLMSANFLEAVDKEKYNELYSILEDSYKKVYSKSKITNYLKELKEKVFVYGDTKIFTEHVINAYTLNNDSYLLQLDFDNENIYLVLFNGRKGYNFTIVE